jgi:predicted transcriptional regulator
MTANTNKQLLENDLHLRISDDLERSLTEIASSYNLKKSTLARIIVQQNLKN